MKMGKDDLQNLIKVLTSQQVNNNNPYVTFAAKVKGGTVLVYTSGKVVFQGANAELSLNNLAINQLASQQVTPLVVRIYPLSAQMRLVMGLIWWTGCCC